MTTQPHTYKPADVLQLAGRTEEQLQQADLERLRAQQSDPWRQRDSDHIFRRDFDHQNIQDRMSGMPGSR